MMYSSFYRLSILLQAVTLLLLSTSAYAVTEIRTIPTRQGVTMDFLAMIPDKLEHLDALIMFPGGNGAGAFKTNSHGVIFGWNFLVRSSDFFVQNGLSVFAVAPPSDHRTGMSTGFRESAEHTEDIGFLTDYLKKIGYDRIFLVGNSRGTISAAAVGVRLKDKQLKGLILTSALEYDNFLKWLPLEQLDMPVLMIHHKNDACRISPIEEARMTQVALNATTAVSFTEVDGGAYPRSQPCDSLSAHGFFGIEEKVVKVISDWVNGHDIPDKIE